MLLSKNQPMSDVSVERHLAMMGPLKPLLRYEKGEFRTLLKIQSVKTFHLVNKYTVMDCYVFIPSTCFIYCILKAQLSVM